MIRCAVAGLGMVSCCGLTVREHFDCLSRAQSGLQRPRTFDDSAFSPMHVGQVEEQKLARWAHLPWLPRERLTHRKSLLASIAAAQAWLDAGFGPEPRSPYRADRVAVVLGNGLLFGPDSVEPILAGRPPARPAYPCLRSEDLEILVDGDGALVALSLLTGAAGGAHEINSACAASGHALALAMLMIRQGLVDLAVAAGVDAMIHPLGMAGFQRVGVVSTRRSDSTKACRPFDKCRDGTAVGEGAAALVLERADSAARRGHRIWGYLDGAGLSVDGYSVTAPHPSGAGAVRSMRAALQSAGLAPADIQYINAHGTGTVLNDTAEALAIHEVFGEHASQLMVSSTKPATGHLIAAAGALEAAIVLLSINAGIVFPTLNLTDPCPSCGGLDLVPLLPRERRIDRAMSNAFGLGGQTSTLVFSGSPVRRAPSNGDPAMAAGASVSAAAAPLSPTDVN